MRETHGGQFWIGLLVGTIAGAGALFLFGTKKGRKLVKRCVETIENYESEAEQAIEDTLDTIEQKKDDMMEKAQEMKDAAEKEMEKHIQKTSETLAQTADTVQEKLESIQEKGREATKEAHRFFKKNGKTLTS